MRKLAGGFAALGMMIATGGVVFGQLALLLMAVCLLLLAIVIALLLRAPAQPAPRRPPLDW
jgi:predicted lipid-binding transport protein (Tim44 family)